MVRLTIPVLLPDPIVACFSQGARQRRPGGSNYDGTCFELGPGLNACGPFAYRRFPADVGTDAQPDLRHDRLALTHRAVRAVGSLSRGPARSRRPGRGGLSAAPFARRALGPDRRPRRHRPAPEPLAGREAGAGPGRVPGAGPGPFG